MDYHRRNLIKQVAPFYFMKYLSDILVLIGCILIVSGAYVLMGIGVALVTAGVLLIAAGLGIASERVKKGVS